MNHNMDILSLLFLIFCKRSKSADDKVDSGEFSLCMECPQSEHRANHPFSTGCDDWDLCDHIRFYTCRLA